VNNRGEEYDYPSHRMPPGMSSGKKQVPPVLRGNSAKVPKLNGFMEEAKQKYVNQNENMYFEDYDDNYKLGTTATKTESQEYDFDIPTEDDLVKLCQDHENLIDLILEEEEEVTSSHKEQLDSEVETVKEEMRMLYDVQKPNSDIKQYVENLHSVLENKIKMMMELKSKVEQFGEHLVQEERLSEEFRRKQEDATYMD